VSGERRFFRLKAGKRNLLAGSEEKIAGAREDSFSRACGLVTRLVGILV